MSDCKKYHVLVFALLLIMQILNLVSTIAVCYLLVCGQPLWLTNSTPRFSSEYFLEEPNSVTVRKSNIVDYCDSYTVKIKRQERK